jgi:hypothetical protein
MARDTKEAAVEYQKQMAEKSAVAKKEREDRLRRQQQAKESYRERKQQSSKIDERTTQQQQQEKADEEEMKQNPPYLRQPQKPLAEIVESLKLLQDGGLVCFCFLFFLCLYVSD